jgi:hypothetical protein
MIKVLDKPHLDLTTPIGLRLHRFPERPSGGRTPAGREASQRRPSCCPEAWGAHGSQAQVDRSATGRRSPARLQGREYPIYCPRVGRGSHHCGAGRRIGRPLIGP